MTQNIRPVAVNANDLVHQLYHGVRTKVRDRFPFLDTHIGNVLSDQAIRSGIHRILVVRSNGKYDGRLSEGESMFLGKQLSSVGIELGRTQAAYGILTVAHEIAQEEILEYEKNENVEITGQTP